MKRKIRVVLLTLGVAGIALAQVGVDNSGATGVFQMEGDATRTATVCFLPFASGGPATATPGSYPPGNTQCPTVNPSGTAAVWQLINFGANTDDWSSFAFNGTKFASKGHSLFNPAFVTDARNSQTDNTFLGASSKDTQDITQWTWNPHGTQDKDDIEHAFAAAYTLANGHTAIYAGMDRFANAGDATAGFWFVQDSTFALCTGAGQSSNGPNAGCKASGTFLGKHFDGDLLIVSDFSIGGAVSTINVFQWQSGTLVLDATRSPAPCDPVGGNNTLCGLVNNAFTQVLNNRGNPVLQAVTVSPGGWSFGDKNGLSAFQVGEFLEISVDLNAIFGSNIPCFSTFFAETRSSTAPTASLSDLTGPVSFPLCSMNVTKLCTGSSIIGGSQVQYNFNGDVTNTGASTIYAATVTDTVPGACTLNLLTQPPTTGIVGGASAGYSGNMTCSSILGSNDQNSVSAVASSSNTGTPLNVGPATADWGDPTTGSCPPTISKGLTLTKNCKSCLVGGTDVSVQVSEAFKVCNTGNVTVSNITVQDCRGGSVLGVPGSQTCSSGSFVTIASIASLAAGACSDQISSSYKPTTAAASYSDNAIASGTAALGGGTVYANGGAPASASCPVCPINTDCATNPPVAQ
jgi:hypothetical protein